MGSTPAGSSSSPGVNPIGAMNYIPQFQPQADKSYFDLVNSLISQYQGAPGQQTQSLLNQYLSGLGQPGGLPFGGQEALTGAQNAAADYGKFANTFGVQDPAALQQMGQTLPQGLIQMGQSLPKGLEQMGAGFPRQLVAAGDQTAKQLWGMGKQTQQQAFDPQSALYNQQAGIASQQATAAEAAGGLQGTPYGAGVASNAINNFNLNWQNNLLQRQIAGGQAAGADFAGAQQAKSSGLMNAEALRQAAYGSAEALRQGAYSGAENLALGGFGGAQNLAQTSDQALASTSGLPYQGGAQIAQNAIQAEAARMAMPAQALGALESYLGLGQSAALNSGALGNLGFNQQMQGIGGSIAGANALLGPQGLFSSGGSGPLSGIFGTSAAAVPGAGADFAGTVGGAGADLGGLAPFSLGPSIGGATGVGGSALAQAGLAPFGMGSG